MSTGAVICNMHCVDFMGPSRQNKNLIPMYFKKPNGPPVPPEPKRRQLSVSTSSAEADMQDSGHQNEELDAGLRLHVASWCC